MSSRKITDLCPRMQSFYARFDAEMRAQRIDYIVTCTYRSNSEQQALYNQGRTTPGNVVTNALPGQSAHNAVDLNGNPASKAFDIVIMESGKPDWNTKNPKWQRAGDIGVKLGLDWAGNWKSFKEFPHFQLPKD